MKKFAYLMLILLTLASSIEADCNEGCLRCKEDNCELCDFSQGLVLRDSSCVFKNVLNCVFYNIHGFCLLCAPDFFVDPGQNKCVQLVNKTKVPNCKVYQFEGVCKTCDEKFYLNSNQCLSVTPEIPNCIIYQGPKKCSVCAEGFTPQFNGGKCVQNATTSNCGVFSTVRCLECDTKNLQEVNYLLYFFNENVDQNQPSLINASLDFFNKTSFVVEEGCVPTQILNCSIFSDFQNCSVCQNGFYLENGKCFKEPEEAIPNCSVYVKVDQCKECVHGYFLQTVKDCVPVQPIENCEIYSTTDDETKCLKCWNSYFLSSNSCQVRTNLSDLCEDYSQTQDRCTKCEDSYDVTTDGKKCLEEVANCNTYLDSSLETTSLVCQQCDHFYYYNLNDQQCVKGDQPHCQTYQTNSNDCVECVEQFWISNGQCVAHNRIDSCTKYDKTLQDICIQCEDETVMMTKKSTCTPVNIDGCKDYKNVSECDVCKDGYDKIDNFTCKLINAGTNCKRAEAGVCQLCELNFILENGACRRPYDYEVKLCEITNITGQSMSNNAVNCQVCLPFAIQKNYKDHYVCLEHEHIETKLGADLIAGCLTYRDNPAQANQLICVSCDHGLKLKGNECVNSCEDRKLKRLLFEKANTKFRLKNKEQCSTDDDSVCDVETMTGDVGAKLIAYGCLDEKNKDRQKKITDLKQTNSNYMILPQDLGTPTETKNVIYKMVPTQITPASDVIRGELVFDVVAKHYVKDCQHYYALHSTEEGCLTCKFGYYGRVLNWKVDNCHLGDYNETQKDCDKCLYGYYINDLGTNGFKCLKNEIASCLRFEFNVNKCKECEENYYLNQEGKQCLGQTKVQNCKIYSQVEVGCLVCGYNHIISTNKLDCQRKIPHCLTHAGYVKGGALQCSQCEDWYFLNTDKKCQLGTIEKCWKYDQTVAAGTTCLNYLNSFYLNSDKICKVPQTPHDGCLEYTDHSKCSKCDETKYHLTTSKICCEFGKYYNTTNSACEATIANCKISNTLTTCEKCNLDYNLDNTNQTCCKSGSYYNSSCTEFAALAPNTVNCEIYDPKLDKCLNCKSGHYLAKSGAKCCATDSLYKEADDDCSDDPKTKTAFCREYDLVNSKCTLCVNTDGTTAITTTNNPHCCNDLSFYHTVETKCKLKPTPTAPCKTLTQDTGANTFSCSACDNTHYFIAAHKACCTLSTHYYNTTTSACATVTTAITSCTEYNDDQTCKVCSAGNLVHKDQKCCPDDETFHVALAKCVTNTIFQQNCISTDDDGQCETCKTGFYKSKEICVEQGKYWNGSAEATLTAGKNCIQSQDDGTTCEKCKDNYFAIPTILQCCEQNTFWETDACVSIQRRTQDCAYFDTATKKCYQDSVAGNDANVCGGSLDTLFIYNDPMCCPQSTKFDSGYCVGGVGDYCIQYVGSACTACLDGYYLLSGTCTVLPVGCKVHDGTDCTECAVGNINLVASKVCQTITTLKTSLNATCGKGIFSDLCIQAKAADSGSPIDAACHCNAHSSFSYGDFACPFGYYFDATTDTENQTCRKISNQYTAKDETAGDTCFYNLDFCTINTIHVYRQENWYMSRNNVSLNVNKNLEPISITNANLTGFEYYYKGPTTKECCPLGQYWKVDTDDADNSACTVIPISNCNQYDATNKQCLKCKDEYHQQNNKKTCCLHNHIFNSFFDACIVNESIENCQTGFYKSNEHCCEESFYWDSNTTQCLPLFDPNCKKSNSKLTCTTCTTGWSVEKLFTKVVLNLDSPKHCQKAEEFYYVQFCVQDTDHGKTTVLDYITFRVKSDNCLEYTFSDNTCKTCMTDSYKTTKNPHCCLNEYFGYKETCRKLEKLTDNCLDYNHEDRICSECLSGYILEEGICCAVGTHLDVRTMQCTITVDNCKSFDVKSGYCSECGDGSYFTNEHCCPTGYWYNTETSACVLIEDNCLKKDAEDECIEQETNCLKQDGDNKCFVCSTSKYYVHKGHCCYEGYYYDDTKKRCIESVDDNFQHCKKFDYFDNCLECKDTHVMNNFKCCTPGTWYHPTSKVCIPNHKIENCKLLSSDGAKCKTCNTTYYVTNDHCCKDNYNYNTTAGKCVPINVENCDEYNDNLYECDTCSSGKYASNKQCCDEGQYYLEGEGCKAITDTDCKQSNDNVNCLKCDPASKTSRIDVNGYKLCIDKTDVTTPPLHCWVVNQADDECDTCDDASYKSDDVKCCNFNNYWDGTNCADNDVLIDAGDRSTKSYSGGCKKWKNDGSDNECEVCKDTHYFANDVCTLLERYDDNAQAVMTTDISGNTLGVTNCQQIADTSTSGDEATKCDVCKPGFTLVQSTDPDQCNANTDTNITCSVKIDGTCNTNCASGQYTILSNCCPVTEIWSGSQGKCISGLLSEKCEQYSSDKCLKCNTATTYLTNGHCCAENQYFDQSECKDMSSIGNGLNTCKQFLNISTCKLKDEVALTTDPDSRLLSCSSSEYFIDNHCCAATKYWDVDQCKDITDLGIETECQMVDEDKKCIKCTGGSKYLSNGRCCATSTYFSQGNSTCLAIDRTNCQQQTGNECTQCSSSVNTNDSKCCTTFYFNVDTKNCTTIPANCVTMSDKGKCLTCDNNYYVSNDKCCNTGEYYNGTACTAIAGTFPNCSRIKDYDTSDVTAVLQCALCNDSFIRNGHCCKQDEIYLARSTACVNEKLFMENTLQLNDDGSVLKCKDDYYVSHEVCCADNTYFNGTICTANLDTNCKENDGINDKCLVCKDTFYPNTNITKNKCCALGIPHNTAKTDCDAAVTIAQCNSFDADKKCLTCVTGYHLYINQLSPGPGDVRGCCKDDYYFFEGNCVKMHPRIEKCKAYDALTKKCNTCSTGSYSSLNYCCLDQDEWSTTNEVCQDVPTDYTLCKEKEGDVCKKCNDEAAQYLLNDGCCLNQDYWNHTTKKCQKILEMNCKKFDSTTGLCTDCITDYYLYDNTKKCCYKGFAYHNGQCRKLIEGCKEYEWDGAKFLCKVCLTGGYLLGVDKDSCCKVNDFFFRPVDHNAPAINEQCKASPHVLSVIPNCAQYNKEDFSCKKCNKNYYVSNTHCCLDDNQYDKTTHACTAIIAGTLSVHTECTQYSGGKCVGCDEANNFYLKADNTCVEVNIGNCNKVDPETSVCTECETSYYITNGHCCLNKKFYNSGGPSCDTINKGNCEQQNNSKCILCDENSYYITASDVCCSHGKYCDGASAAVDGTVKFCLEYGSSIDVCKKCDPRHSLSVLKDGKHFCYPIDVEGCQDSWIEEINDNLFLRCKTCKNQYFEFCQDKEEYVDHLKIEHCTRFENTNLLSTSTLKCVACKESHFLDSGACSSRLNTANCHAPYTNFIEDKCSFCQIDYKLKSTNTLCEDPRTHQADCDYFDFITGGQDQCLKCKSTHYRYSTWIDIPGDTYSSLCISKTDAQFTNESVEAPAPKFFKGYMPTCYKNFECKNIYLNGLPTLLDIFVSCHVCEDDNRLPVIPIKSGDNSNDQVGIGRFDENVVANETLNELKDNLDNLSNQCFKKDLTEFNGTGGTAMIDHCALMILNSDKLIDLTQNAIAVPDKTKLSLYCGACKPGYSPSYSDAFYHVHVCTLIQNCSKFGSAFNQCDECNSNNAFEYLNSGGINRSKCVSSVKNCYAQNINDSKCQICQTGYSLNIDNQCEIFNAPHCEKGKMSFNKWFEFQDVELAIYRGFSGCQMCSQGFKGFYQTVDEFVCTDSSYVKGGSLVSNSKLHKNCMHYTLNKDGSGNWLEDDFICYKCNKEFLLTSDGKCVATVGTLEHCKIAQNSQTCHTCIDTHILQNNVCVVKNILNCETYTNNVNPQNCTKCVGYYYLFNKECVKGLILNCQVYLSKNDCSVCEKGYQKILIKDNEHYCIPITTHENCDNFNDSEFQNKQINCVTCSENYFLESLQIQTKVCNQYHLIPNCKSYDKAESFLQSSFKCTECHIGYYLSDNTCIQRNAFITNCLNYFINSQKCKLCEKEYFLNESNTECIINPFGIAGCDVYANKDTCQDCKNGYYLENNKCLAVPTDNLKEFCIAYSNATTCSRCNTDKVLVQNVCQNPTVLNCVDYENEASCKVCAVNYGIRDNGGTKICEALPSITNCLTISTTFPFICVKCLDGYFISNDACQEALPIIENCVSYSALDLCSKCLSGFILSVDRKSCQATVINNRCDTFREESEPFCILCNPGFQLNENRECVAIDSDHVNKGDCLLFNFNNSTHCEICKKGFTQNSLNECLNLTEINNPTNSTNANPETTNNQDGKVFSLNLFLVWLMSFLFI